MRVKELLDAMGYADTALILEAENAKQSETGKLHAAKIALIAAAVLLFCETAAFMGLLRNKAEFRNQHIVEIPPAGRFRRHFRKHGFNITGLEQIILRERDGIVTRHTQTNLRCILEQVSGVRHFSGISVCRTV